ncbi:MAG: aminotransferase class V-fold PLP-dependent enzyme [candidate division Zixibacteria bacterium]|nr:aminotransferase class V-fold PLP-dependent enzyme [candidate division Zixibacteria bacterium]
MLISKSEFIGLEGLVHLCAGGETPMLKTHQDAVNRFFEDKIRGEESRDRFFDTSAEAKDKIGRLFGVPADDIAFLSSASEGVNLLVYALDWQAGDNVIVADVEFPSDLLPWTRLRDRGVEIRVIKNRNWQIDIADIAAQMDDRTRVVSISYVSYFTGQRIDLKKLSDLVRSSRAILSLDATHAAGAVPVEASLADIVVSSCYKWLMGVHGVGIFYWNRNRLPDLQPPFVGWHTGSMLSGWQDPTAFEPRPDAGRFEPGNESFISVYVLNNALDRLFDIGLDRIEDHVLRLSGRVWEGLAGMGWEMMTPRGREERAGNVCFMAEDVRAVTSALEARDILIWGSYGGVGRARVSTHFYNTDEDVDAFLSAMQTIPGTAAAAGA